MEVDILQDLATGIRPTDIVTNAKKNYGVTRRGAEKALARVRKKLRRSRSRMSGKDELEEADVMARETLARAKTEDFTGNEVRVLAHMAKLRQVGGYASQIRLKHSGKIDSPISDHILDSAILAAARTIEEGRAAAEDPETEK